MIEIIHIFAAACEQPMDQGPCEGNYERWYYEKESDSCRSFTYGGCKGNKNNYPSEHACNYYCRQPGIHKGLIIYYLLIN